MLHLCRNSSGGITVWPSGVSVAWNAYRWLENICPAEPYALSSSKLKMCATPSNTNASPIMGHSLVGGLGFRRRRQVPGDILARIRNLGGRREETQLLARGVGEPVGGPGLVPDDLDIGTVDARKLAYDSLDLGQHRRGERAPSGRQQQLDPGMATIDPGLVQQPHVDDRDALVTAARIVDVAESGTHGRIDLRPLCRHLRLLECRTTQSEPGYRVWVALCSEPAVVIARGVVLMGVVLGPLGDQRSKRLCDVDQRQRGRKLGGLFEHMLVAVVIGVGCAGRHAARLLQEGCFGRHRHAEFLPVARRWSLVAPGSAA